MIKSILKLVYKASGTHCSFYGMRVESKGSILTTQKPDDVNKPCGYIEDGCYKPFGLGANKEVYCSPFTNRWE